MSVENLQAFRKKVDQSDGLQQEVRAFVTAGNVDDVVTLGKKHGFEFSAADLREVFGGFIAELSQSQLESVVGGVSGSPQLSLFEQNVLIGAGPSLRQECQQPGQVFQQF